MSPSYHKVIQMYYTNVLDNCIIALRIENNFEWRLKMVRPRIKTLQTRFSWSSDDKEGRCDEKIGKGRTRCRRRAGGGCGVGSDYRECNERTGGRGNEGDDCQPGTSLGTLGGRARSDQVGRGSGVCETRRTISGGLDR